MHRESKISLGSIVFCLNFSDVMWKPTISLSEMNISSKLCSMYPSSLVSLVSRSGHVLLFLSFGFFSILSSSCSWCLSVSNIPSAYIFSTRSINWALFPDSFTPCCRRYSLSCLLVDSLSTSSLFSQHIFSEMMFLSSFPFSALEARNSMCWIYSLQDLQSRFSFEHASCTALSSEECNFASRNIFLNCTIVLCSLCFVCITTVQ